MSNQQDNSNVNEMMKKKRARNRKKRMPNPNLSRPNTTPNPDTIEALKTIANIMQLHKQLTRIGQTGPTLRNPTSGPEVGNPPRFTAPGAHLTKAPLPTSSTITRPTVPTSKIPEIAQNIQKSQTNVQKSQGNTNNEKPNFTISQKPLTKHELLTKNNEMRQNKLQFDDFDANKQSAYISFEESNKVVDLNDDGLFNNLPNSDRDKGYMDKRNIIKSNSESNFQVKLQQQYAKKMETKLQSASPNPKSEQVPDNLKQLNNEVLKGVSADITVVVKNNVQSNRWDKDPSQMERVTHQERRPAGIPRSFLHQQNPINAIEPPPQTNIDPEVNSLQFPLRPKPTVILDSKLFIQTNLEQHRPQAYSPTDAYQEMRTNEVSESHERSISPDESESGQKRVSAFQRLGPLAQPKKPKLTINLCVNKEGVREVVDETNINIPVYDREDINNSTDEIVVKYLPFWPWKKSIFIKNSASLRNSKTVMMMEKEQMEEIYKKDNIFIIITVSGYPPSWTKEDLLDVLLENLKGKSFIPCFTEFTTTECKFFVIRCRSALLAIHWLNFTIRKDDVQLSIVISHAMLNMNHIEFLPRIVLRKMLVKRYDGERKLNLSEFTLKNDISHFIYYPLHRTFNQTELLELQSSIIWEYLTELDLSCNKISSIEGFHLETKTPRLRVLDLAHNCLNSVLVLMPWRYLPIQKLNLQGNPLCMNYIDSDYYVKVVKTMFSGLRELDGVQITMKGELPPFKRNYSTPEADPIVSKFLEVYFPLFEVEPDDRNIEKIYDKNAVLTITTRNKLRYNQSFKYARNLLLKSRDIFEGNLETVEGVNNIVKLVEKWPKLEHDPATFTVDVLSHDETSTIVKVTGILKIITKSLHEDEPLMAFSKTIHLMTKNGWEYKIYNEMLYWDAPTKEYAKCAFKSASVVRKTLSLNFQSTPDDETKDKLIKIFMKITELNEEASERCLEAKNWHIKDALEYFMKLLKLDNIQSL